MSDSEDEDLSEVMDEDEDSDSLQSSLTDSLKRQNSFEVIELDALLDEAGKLISNVMEVCGVPTQDGACRLLRHMKWNKERLVEQWMENSDDLCKEAGLNSFQLESAPSSKKVECPICMEVVPSSETFALGCGHSYCHDCWTSYLELKIQQGPGSINAACPWPKCRNTVNERAFKRHVRPDLFKRYSNFLCRSFVDDNPQMKWCPAPGCERSIRCDRKGRREGVTCLCGFCFCFSCADFEVGDHVPATCAQMEKWLQKASDESENVTWMVANTKRCPQCRSPIEKNGGCMHMTCSKASGGCGFEFCWLCRGAWKDHGSATGGFYACNRYDKSTAKQEDDKAQDTKTELEHYMFYYHRYESHRGALKIADQQRKNCGRKEEEILTKFDVRPADVRFLMDATEQLIANRRVLQFSYVYGFYLSDKRVKTESNLFVYLQEDLEKHTNHLSTLYEHPLPKLSTLEDFNKWKMDVTNYTRVSRKFLDNFKEGVTAGLVADD